MNLTTAKSIISLNKILRKLIKAKQIMIIFKIMLNKLVISDVNQIFLVHYQSISSKMTQPITLTWKKLTATVKDKTILSEASGYCRPGELLAIMGPSGSGKTTLLSLLTHKNDPAVTVTGNVVANKVAYNAQTFYNFGTFIYQNDILYQTLTVRQTLQFGAKIIFDSQQAANKRVNELVSQFQLHKCMDILVGGQFKKGISGGEKKRLCIAVEMISRPSVIILDEPTSGLDSSKAGRVLKVLKKLSNQGHTIIFTIHQPSFLLYSMLDKLIVLNLGQTIYQGSASEISNYLQNKLHLDIPKNSTICDFFMMELSDYKKVKLNYQTPFNYTNYKKHLKKSIKKQSELLTSQVEELGFKSLDYNQSFCKMFKLLLSRQFTNYKRNPMKFFSMIGNALIMVVILGMFFINSIPSIDDISSLYQGSPSFKEFYKIVTVQFIKAQGTSFVNCTSNIMVGIFSVALAFPLQRPIFYKESTSKKYTPIAYFIAKLIIQASSVIVGATLYASIGYWLLGYTQTFEQYIFFMITLMMMALVGNSIGFFTGCLFQDAKKASGMSPLLLLPLMMFSGLYNKLNSIPSWISWLQYISPFRYGLHMTLLNQYKDTIYTYVDPNSGIPYVYNYKTDLSISLSWVQNFGVLISISLLFYGISFLLLTKSKRLISV